ncbi:hypothetical protein [Actinotalea sp. K2]|nr:hypothetical protein [Actinotalea sp. K2]MCL3860421.1 hypothetical protein [Actinotalea sp. K2]
MTEPDDRLFAELVVLGRHVHWSLGELLDLEHATRRRIIAELVDPDDRG